MHIQVFFTLTMGDLEKLGIEPLAVWKPKLHLAIPSQCCWWEAMGGGDG